MSVEIKPSANQKKKTDLCNMSNKFIVSIRANLYMDYSTYLQQSDK